MQVYFVSISTVNVLYIYIDYYYRLAVHHHGKFAVGGHYTCHVLRDNGDWLHIDDTTITSATLEQVSQEQSDRQPYMLFYTR